MTATATSWLAVALAVAATGTVRSEEKPAAGAAATPAPPDRSREPMRDHVSVSRAAEFLDTNVHATETSCFTCHGSYVYLMARPAIAIPSDVLRETRRAMEQSIETRPDAAPSPGSAHVTYAVMTAVALSLNDAAAAAPQTPQEARRMGRGRRARRRRSGVSGRARILHGAGCGRSVMPDDMPGSPVSRRPFMRHLWILVGFLCGAVAYSAPLTITEIRTASDTVLVAFFKSPNASGPVWNRVIQVDEVKTDDPSRWKLNGQPVAAIHRFVTPADDCDHHIYLQTPKLVQGTSYTLETPYGSTPFVFDDRQIYCESIKVNQNAYSALSRVRYANFAIWLGTGGAQPISGALPAYTVFRQFTGEPVAQGRLQQIGRDESSGDFVYRIDLASVPEGGPYRISVKGYGCSYPFGVGADFSRRLGYVSFRALYYQRCGCPIVEPYARANVRPKPCHTLIYDTREQPGEANVKVKGTEPPVTVHGGYHDAGDADRRLYHLMVPVVLLTTYEVFPGAFTDDQFNIPDKFDANFKILGKGNGIPDILDEAVWGTLFWECMQTTTGAVHWGTETDGYPNWGISFDQDTKRYGTLRTDDRASGFAAGLFMNLARVIKPHNPRRSAELQKRGEMAFGAAGDRIRPTHRLYYAIQKYLLTGDEAAHTMVKSLAPATRSFPDTYCNEAGGFAVDGRYWLASFFMSYLVEKARPTDPAVVKQLAAALKAAADQEIEYLDGTAYPVGWPASMDVKQHNWNQGAFTSQGQLAYPCLMQWALTKEQKYLDAASQLMDYVQGLNPIGKCYMSGIGFDRVHHPHDRESTYAQDQGWGPRPGIVVYGPVLSGIGEQVPAPKGLARERRFVDHLGSYQMNEFTVYQSLVFPASIYPVLARGGTWDPTKDPFASPRK